MSQVERLVKSVAAVRLRCPGLHVHFEILPKIFVKIGGYQIRTELGEYRLYCVEPHRETRVDEFDDVGEAVVHATCYALGDCLRDALLVMPDAAHAATEV